VSSTKSISVAVSKGMQAAKLTPNEILQFLTGGADWIVRCNGYNKMVVVEAVVLSLTPEFPQSTPHSNV